MYALYVDSGKQDYNIKSLLDVLRTFSGSYCERFYCRELLVDTFKYIADWISMVEKYTVQFTLEPLSKHPVNNIKIYCGFNTPISTTTLVKSLPLIYRFFTIKNSQLWIEKDAFRTDLSLVLYILRYLDNVDNKSTDEVIKMILSNVKYDDTSINILTAFYLYLREMIGFSFYPGILTIANGPATAVLLDSYRTMGVSWESFRDTYSKYFPYLSINSKYYSIFHSDIFPIKETK